MKTLLVLASVLILSSCKKDYVCECSVQTTVSYNGSVINSYSETSKEVIKKASKKTAKEQCKNSTSQADDNGVHKEEVSTCSLK